MNWVLDVQSPFKNGFCLNMFLAFKGLTVSGHGRPIHSIIHSYFLSSYSVPVTILRAWDTTENKICKIYLSLRSLYSLGRGLGRDIQFIIRDILINNGNLIQTQVLSLTVTFTESVAIPWHDCPSPALVDYVPFSLRHSQAEALNGHSMIES